MKYLKVFVIILFFLLPGFCVWSQIQIIGSDLTWTNIGKDSFIVKLTLYRDCNGGKMPKSISLNVECASSGQKITDLVINASAPVDITPACRVPCTRCQDSLCSFPYGIEQYYFTKLLILPDTFSCCDIRISYLACCRSKSITTGLANTNFYTYADFNNCLFPSDNSPIFTNPPIGIICKNSQFIFNNGVIDIDIDTTGGLLDSMSFELVCPLIAKNVTATYDTPYSFTKPLKFSGFPVSSLSFPDGFNIDQWGEIMFTPTENDFTTLALKVCEWRKINNQMVKIGEVIRNITFIFHTCPYNNFPILSGPFYKEVKAGGLVSFSIGTNDYDTEDSLLISWNSGLPGASFSTTNHNEKHPTATINWQTTKTDARVLPYVFTLTVIDDNCFHSHYNGKGISTRAYEVLVWDSSTINSLENINNNEFRLYPNPANDRIFIESESGISKLILYNFIGTKVREYDIENKTSLTIDNLKLSSGLYLLKVFDINGKTELFQILIR